MTEGSSNRDVLGTAGEQPSVGGEALAGDTVFTYSKRFAVSRSVMWLLAEGILTFISIILVRAGDTMWGGLIFVFAYVLIFPLYIITCLTYSAIKVTPSGVAALVFGMRWKMVRWSDIREVASIREWDAGALASKEKYYIYTSSSKNFLSPKGPILVDESISGLGSLLKIISQRSVTHGFPYKPAGGRTKST